MRFTTTTAIVAAGALAVVLSGCAVGGPLKTEDQTQEYAEKITRVEVSLDSGDVRFSPATGEAVSVTRRLSWRADKPVVSETFDGGTMKISVKCPKIGTCAVDYKLGIPAAASVRVRTDSGDISVDGITGDVDAQTDSGDINVAGAAGVVRLSTDSGDVEGAELRSADAKANSDSGDVTLAFTAAPTVVDAHSDSGDVTVTVPPADGGYKVTAATDAGSRTVTVTEAPTATRTITAKTDSGDVTVS